MVMNMRIFRDFLLVHIDFVSGTCMSFVSFYNDFEQP